jgi:hypothetical protein
VEPAEPAEVAEPAEPADTSEESPHPVITPTEEGSPQDA